MLFIYLAAFTHSSASVVRSMLLVGSFFRCSFTCLNYSHVVKQLILATRESVCKCTVWRTTKGIAALVKDVVVMQFIFWNLNIMLSILSNRLPYLYVYHTICLTENRYLIVSLEELMKYHLIYCWSKTKVSSWQVLTDGLGGSDGVGR